MEMRAKCMVTKVSRLGGGACEIVLGFVDNGGPLSPSVSSHGEITLVSCDERVRTSLEEWLGRYFYLDLVPVPEKETDQA